MNARDLLEHAASRPWSFHKGYLNGAAGEPICRFVTETLAEIETSGVNGPLLLTAVNEYEALLDIAETADAYAQDNTFEKHAALANTLHRLDALRADLSPEENQGRPHSREERAGSPDNEGA